MFRSSTVQRFSLLLLDEGEDYIADYNVFCHAECILGRTSQSCHGKMRLCTKSVFFDADDISIPILRLPFQKIETCSNMGPKKLLLTSMFYTTMKKNNLDRPYMHCHLQEPTSVTITLEFASMDVVMLHMMRVLQINKIPSITERDECLKALAREQVAGAKFDYRRLHDEFNETILKECPARLLTPLVRQPGLLVVTDKGLYFRPLHDIAGDTVVRHHPLRAVASLARRTVSMRPVGLEVFMLMSGGALFSNQLWGAPSALFMFEDAATREAVHAALSTQPHLGADIRGSSALQRGALLEGRGSWLLHVQSAWLSGRVSNLEYLLYLNLAAGRSFNDLAQWPVFPWVLRDYTSPTLDLGDDAAFRDLSRPMGALGHPARLAEARERLRETSALYNASDANSDPGFMYGSHYSSPGYVMYWLVRSTPEQMLRLQNGRFDSPDRLFFSIAESWNSSSGRSNTDVKELIPEFFLPGPGDFLLNRKNLLLGRRQNGQLVGDVVLPPWADSAADFIWKHRQALESEHVQRHLHLWIDLIFGCKQRGEAAVAADNVFRHTSYEGAVDLDAISDPVMRIAKEMMISEFGQTPAQLFDEHQPHPPRRVITPVPSQPLPGYCGTAGDGQEVSQALLHILLAAAASEPVSNVLASPSGKGLVGAQRSGTLGTASLHASPISAALEAAPATAPRSVSGPSSEGDVQGDAHAGPAGTSQSVPLGREPSHGLDNVVEQAQRLRQHMATGVSRVRNLFSSFSAVAASDAAAPTAAAPPGLAPALFQPPAQHQHQHQPERAPWSEPGAHAPSEGAEAWPDSGTPINLDAAASGRSDSARPLEPASYFVEGQSNAQPLERLELGRSGDGPPDRLTGAQEVDWAAVMQADTLHRLWPVPLHERLKAARPVHLPGADTTAVACHAGLVLSGSSNGLVRAHKCAEGVALRSFKLPRASPIHSLLALPAPSAAAPAAMCALAASFSSVYAYSVDYGTLLGSFAAHADVISAMGVGAAAGAGAAPALFTASHDTTVKVWAAGDGSAPWLQPSPPLLEMDTPDASAPLCMQVHAASGLATVGTDAGHCVVYDPRTGQDVWQWGSDGAAVNALALVPAPELQTVVLAHADGTCRLLDLRRQASHAVLAEARYGAALRCCVTDGCVAVAGTAAGDALVWDLDPAHDRGDGSGALVTSGAGPAFACTVGGSSCGAMACIASSSDVNGAVHFAMGHDGGLLHLCTFAVEI